MVAGTGRDEPGAVIGGTERGSSQGEGQTTRQGGRDRDERTTVPRVARFVPGEGRKGDCTNGNAGQNQGRTGQGSALQCTGQGRKGAE